MKDPFQAQQELEVLKEHAFYWVVSIVLVIVALLSFGKFDAEAQKMAHEAEQERIEEMRLANEEKARIERVKIALYKQAQDMTGFGQMVVSK